MSPTRARKTGSRTKSAEPGAKKSRKKSSNWGGRRPGAGRPKSPDSGVSHAQRAKVSSKHPVLITQRLRPGLPTLRKKPVHDLLEGLLTEVREELEDFGLRILHYALRKDEILYVVEAQDRDVLSRGLQGIGVSVSRRLNALLGRQGKVYRDRYEERPLRTAEDLRAAYAELFLHARRGRSSSPDPYGSGDYFDGWQGYEPYETDEDAPVSRPRSALARTGWRKAGLLKLNEKLP